MIQTNFSKEKRNVWLVLGKLYLPLTTGPFEKLKAPPREETGRGYSLVPSDML
jgi:hypothetical protein